MSIASLTSIARVLNLDKSTVSKALKGNPRIALATRDLVRQEAQRQGYRPNALRSRMAGTRWRRKTDSGQPPVLVLLYGRGIDFLAELRAPLRDALGQLGYRMAECDTSDPQEARRQLRVHYQRGGEGVIIGPSDHLEQLDSEIWQAFSVVSLLSGHEASPFDTVRPDTGQTIQRSVARLRALGCRRPGLLIFDEHGSYDEILRTGGFMYAVQPDNRFQVRPAVLALPLEEAHPKQWYGLTPASWKQLRQWIEQEQVDGVVGLNDLMGLWLEQGGWSNLAEHFISMSKLPEAHCTGYLQPYATMAHTAVNWLDQLIRTGTRGRPQARRDILVEQSFSSFPVD